VKSRIPAARDLRSAPTSIQYPAQLEIVRM
jgi:hypothetical protein